MNTNNYLLCSCLAVAASSNLVVANDVADVKEKKKKPNIIFILADDLGYGDLSCNGQTKFQTPNIDALAKRGMKFTSFYSNQSVCAPARCSIMTGKHQGRCSIRSNKELQGEGQESMKETVTLATLLGDNGYKTACIGKWGLGAPGAAGDPTKRGFDLFYGMNCQRHSHFYYPKYVWRNLDKEILTGNNIHTGTKYFPALAKNEAVKFIEDNKDEPFFIWYTTPIPHASLQAPKKYVDKFVGKMKEKPFRNSGHYTNTEFPRATFAAMVTHLDDEVGAMIQTLKKNGLYDNTIIIFASDNGPSNEGGHDPDYFNSAAPNTRGNKRELADGGIRVPFIVAWPNNVKGGEICNKMFAFQDILPTLIDAVGGEIPTDIDGVSMVPILTGNNDKQKYHDFLYWEYPGHFGGQVAVRYGHWKAIATNINKQVKFKLYNLKKDPKETTDVAKDNPTIMNNIYGIILREHKLSDISEFRMMKYEQFINKLK